jgi:hypothetical protein
MNSKKTAFIIILIFFSILSITFLTGCATLGISLETDYGSFTYELPEPKGTKK